MLVAQRDRAKTLERQLARIIPSVFHFVSGKRAEEALKSYDYPWREACKDAGCPGMIVHDFRRTAVRNFERAGVPRSVAMALTGHLTETVYRRYDIVSERDLAEGVEKLVRLSSAK